MQAFIVRACACLCPVRKWRKEFRRRFLPSTGADVVKGSVFSSQFGEDRVVQFAFALLQKRGLVGSITYLDIGANHPLAGNNSYFLYAMGYKGVIIEPNPVLFSECVRQRPRDVALNIGIHYTSDNVDMLPFYKFDEDPGLSSFDKAAADGVLRAMPNIKSYAIIPTKIERINAVVERYFGGKAPDFVSIDCEGLDFAILRTFDFEHYRPLFICAETADPCVGGLGRKDQEFLSFMRSKGYEVYADTYVNTIFIEKGILEKMYV